MKFTQQMTMHLQGEGFSSLQYDVLADGQPTGIVHLIRTSGSPRYETEADEFHFGEETLDRLKTDGPDCMARSTFAKTGGIARSYARIKPGQHHRRNMNPMNTYQDARREFWEACVVKLLCTPGIELERTPELADRLLDDWDERWTIDKYADRTVARNVSTQTPKTPTSPE